MTDSHFTLADRERLTRVEMHVSQLQEKLGDMLRFLSKLLWAFLTPLIVLSIGLFWHYVIHPK